MFNRFRRQKKDTERTGHIGNTDAVMYHVAPQDVRDAITMHGIDATKGTSPWGDSNGVTGWVGNYLWPTKDLAEWYANDRMLDPADIYEVNTKGLKVTPDPMPSHEIFEEWETPPNDYAAYRTFDPIEPSRVNLIIPSNSERIGSVLANILDPIHDTLDPRMWNNPASPEPTLKPEHSKFIHEKIFSTLQDHGYDGMERWLSLVLTGSLTTYQYSDTSDCDISLFVDSVAFPEWSRAEMIGIMVQYCDGTLVPGTPFPLQDFVVSRKLKKENLYKPGLRSGYDLATDTWIVPPDKSRVHDVEHEMNLAYTQALEAADKMDRLLTFEPLQAIRYWHTIHKKRQRDMQHGLGDYSNSNVVYKMLANHGMFDRISELTGEHIAKVADFDYRMEHEAPGPDEAPIHELEADYAPDFYAHPEYYTTQEPEFDQQSVPVLMGVRGKPNAMVNIYRAGPTNQINPGDWVTISRNYAKQHAKHPTDSSQDIPVWRTKVPANTLFWDGNSIHEFGYHGPAMNGVGRKPAKPKPIEIPEMDEGEVQWAVNLADSDGKDWHRLTPEEKVPYLDRMWIKPKSGATTYPEFSISSGGDQISGRFQYARGSGLVG